jgi:hypothetical protein
MEKQPCQVFWWGCFFGGELALVLRENLFQDCIVQVLKGSPLRKALRAMPLRKANKTLNMPLIVPMWTWMPLPGILLLFQIRQRGMRIFNGASDIQAIHGFQPWAFFGIPDLYPYFRISFKSLIIRLLPSLILPIVPSGTAM